MKLNNTYIVFDRRGAGRRRSWARVHSAITQAILAMRWPDGEDPGIFRIPQIITIRKGQSYTDKDGTTKVVQDSKGKTLRNGVRPIRDQFRRRMVAASWKPEHPLSLAGFFEKLREEDKLLPFEKYPGSEEKVLQQVLNESVGDFDFWFTASDGFRTVVEWETGNISSSHRSLNKMCMALMAGLTDAGVLVVPSIRLYPHLTDRIGNIRELQPYFYFWKQVGTLVDKGLLAVVEVEHDELFQSTDACDYIPTGPDGNSRRRSEEI